MGGTFQSKAERTENVEKMYFFEITRKVINWTFGNFGHRWIQSVCTFSKPYMTVKNITR